MSHDDPYRPRDTGPDRGAYTPPTEDDLPFDSQPYQRRGPTPTQAGFTASGRGTPPITLIISGLVLLGIIIAVVVYYRAGPRASNDAPRTIGTQVEQMKVEAPLDAQPIDPEAGIGVHDGAAPAPTEPTFVPPPEAVQPRPEPRPTPVETAPPAATTPAAPPKKEPAQPPAPAAGGNSSVQIGAFSTPGQAENEYAAIVGRYPQFTRGASRRVQEVRASSGATVYRTTVTGISREQADRLCGAIRSSGGDCFVR